MAGKEDVQYPYQLVKFETKNKKGLADIDCVPSAWVRFNINSGKCECKYPPPPYDEETCQPLHDFVKKQAPPPESWPSFPITLQGQAQNYADALQRLTQLKTEDYAYTTDNNISKANKAAKITKMYRQKIVKSNAKLVKKLLKVPEIRTSSRNDNSANASDISNSSHNDETIINRSDGSDEDTGDESTDENSNIQQKTRRHSKIDNKLREDSNYPSDEDYTRENPKKSLKSLGKRIGSNVSTVKPPDSSGSRVLAEVKKKQPAILKKGTHSISATSLGDMNSSEVRGHSRSESLRSQSATANIEAKESLLVAINALKYEVQEMTKEFRELKGTIQKSALAQDAFGANVQSFASVYDVSLPMRTIEDFKSFDDRLQMEKSFRKEFTSTLHYLIDSRATVSKNITAVLKKHLTRELAVNFTAVKASGTKTIFKDTVFCRCLLEVSCLKCKIIDKDTAVPIADKLFDRELGNVLSNSIDWESSRKLRPQCNLSHKDQAEMETGKGKEDNEDRVKDTVNEGSG